MACAVALLVGVEFRAEHQFVLEREEQAQLEVLQDCQDSRIPRLSQDADGRNLLVGRAAYDLLDRTAQLSIRVWLLS